MATTTKPATRSALAKIGEGASGQIPFASPQVKTAAKTSTRQIETKTSFVGKEDFTATNVTPDGSNPWRKRDYSDGFRYVEGLGGSPG
jgi:hypothetical protein